MGYDSGKARFNAAARSAQLNWNAKRRSSRRFLGEDFTAIAEQCLQTSLWPFRERPVCVPVSALKGYPCNVVFADTKTLLVPSHGTSIWNFIHQLSHWCLPLEGHNEHFCSFFAALIEQAYGERARILVCNAYEQYGVDYHSDWLGETHVRYEYLRPFIKRRSEPEAPTSSILRLGRA